MGKSSRFGTTRVRVGACHVCRTDLQVVDGDLGEPSLPIVPGHKIVGRVEAIGTGVEAVGEGNRVGLLGLDIPAGECDICRAGRENLCPSARFTGYQIDGGYSDYTLVDQRYRFPIHRHYDDTAAAPSRGAMERNSLSLPRGCRFGQPCGSEG